MAKSKRVDEVSPILEIGLDLSMKVRGEKYEATVRGWKPDSFIMLDCEAVTSGTLKVVPDTAVIARFINKGFVLSCSTTIASILKQPLNLVILEFPTRYEKMQIRKFPRLDTCLPALFNDMSAATPEAKNTRHKATALDVSLGGVLIASKQKLEVSQRIALSIKLSGTDKITNILSVVKNVPKANKVVGSETYHLAGVAYQDLSEDNKAKLVRFVEANRPFRN